MQPDGYPDRREELDALFDYNPPTLVLPPDHLPPSTLTPLWFYDKHLDPSSALLRVCLLPSLVMNISKTVDATLDLITDSGTDLPPIGFTFISQSNRENNTINNEVVDPYQVAQFYQETTMTYCEAVASTLALHPQALEWTSAIDWAQTRELKYPVPSFCEDNFVLRAQTSPGTNLLHPELLEFMDGQKAKGLQNAVQRFPALATWEICHASEESEKILRDMDRITTLACFDPDICHTQGHPSIPSPINRTPDAKTAPWNISDDKLRTRSAKSREVGNNSEQKTPDTPHLRRSMRLREKIEPTKRKNLREQKQRTEVIPPLKHNKSRPAVTTLPPTAEHFVQHAWTRSVCSDTSIIVFLCGNFERIGIRHRKTQTLYLSDVIHIPSCKDPAYGKLHIGLYIAAVNDAIDRADQLQEAESKVTSPVGLRKSSRNKRPAADTSRTTRQAKRKTDVEPHDDVKDSKDNDDIDVLQEAKLRNLVLLRLQYEVFNSITPASFMRVGESLSPMPIDPLDVKAKKRKYLPHQYITLTLTSKFASGATGVLHLATLEIQTEKGSIATREVVVKLAFSPEQQERMRNEYSVYRHLASSGAQGIIPVYGLFEDLEGDAMALVMDHAGTSLYFCRANPDPDDFNVSVPASERTLFLRAMKSIHHAGVRHNDIRPLNLMINEAGTVRIIDFDKADMVSSEGARKREYHKLKSLLEGDYIDSDGMPSPKTPDGPLSDNESLVTVAPES